jgi:GNAT superfamily N-acetyltransferase
MPLSILPVRTSRELDLFIKFPWVINRRDSNWVPPLLKERKDKLDLLRNPFWRSAERELYLAVRDDQPVGTIAAIIDHHHNNVLKVEDGLFGFFDCLNDQEVADRLFSAAESWLKQKAMRLVRGPYNPSATDECGILVEGFNTRPALLEAHNPSYYANLVQNAGYGPCLEMVARMAVAPSGARQVEDILSEKLMRAVEKIQQRTDVVLRTIILKDWEREISLACSIYNRSLNSLPGYVPVQEEEFKAFADGFKPILDPDLAQLAEVKGVPVAFALALPDITPAFQKANGRLGPVGLFHIWKLTRKPARGTFKILMVLPDYQNRGIETLLVLAIARAAFRKGYREMDMSLTGSENEKSNRFQENLGYRVYRRYLIFEKYF